MDSTQALRQPLGTRLSSAPLPRAADAVRLLTCVQSQDSLGRPRPMTWMLSPTMSTQALQRIVQRLCVERSLQGGVTPDYSAVADSGRVQAPLSQLIGVGIRPEHVRIPFPATHATRQSANRPEAPAVVRA